MSDTLNLSQDAFNARMIGGVIEATRPAGESAADTRNRAAAIIEMFRSFNAANPMESMIACHCITLQFVLNAAMRDAGDVTLAHPILIRLRASAMSISKTLHLWISKFETMHARGEARAIEARKQNEAQKTPERSPVIVTAREPEPKAESFEPPVPPDAIAHSMPVRAPGGVKEALLSSVATIAGTVPNGKLIVRTPEPVT